MNSTTSPAANRPGAFAGILAASVAVLVSAFIGLVMASTAPGLGADFAGKWLTGWAIGLMFTMPVSWLSVAGVRRRSHRPSAARKPAVHARLA